MPTTVAPKRRETLNGVLTPKQHPSVDHLVTEDDTPVDNLYSEKQQRLFTEPLYSSRPLGKRRFLAAANVGLFFNIHKPPLIPDGLLSVDVEAPKDLWPKSHRSYFTWEYGKVPDVVLEVVSNRKGGEGDVKLQAYAALGIPYYVIWDPQNWLKQGRLRVFGLNKKKYEVLNKAWFPDLELGLAIWPGKFEGALEDWLRWIDGTGKVVPTGDEKATHQKKRAGLHKQRALKEKQRADQEKRRADRLAAKLRALGVNPDQ